MTERERLEKLAEALHKGANARIKAVYVSRFLTVIGLVGLILLVWLAAL